MRISNIIDKLFDLINLPLKLTENHKRKSVRVIGVLLWVILFFPSMLLLVIIGGLLAIPALIQDA